MTDHTQNHSSQSNITQSRRPLTVLFRVVILRSFLQPIWTMYFGQGDKWWAWALIAIPVICALLFVELMAPGAEYRWVYSGPAFLWLLCSALGVFLRRRYGPSP